MTSSSRTFTLDVRILKSVVTKKNYNLTEGEGGLLEVLR